MTNSLPEKKDFPNGYEKVTTGYINVGDMLWNVVHKHWQLATSEIDTNVCQYASVIRKMKKIEAPAKKVMTPVEALEFIVHQANAQFSCGDQYATFNKQAIGLIEEVLGKEHQK